MSRRISEIIGGDINDDTVVTMQTYLYSDSVLYTVVDGNPDGGDQSNAVEVWRKDVPFGADRRHRAAGPAFAEAAREQEDRAVELFEAKRVKP